MTQKISAVIVFNDEHDHIEECIRRIRFCDEIVIININKKKLDLDLQREQIKVFSHKWVPYAEQVRAFAIQKATYDWILLTDPDLYYPYSIETSLRSLIIEYDNTGLAIVQIPYRNFFGKEPLKYGRKSTISSFVGLINRNRVTIDGLIHHRGIKIKEDCFELGVVKSLTGCIQHHWINKISDAYKKAHRYMPYEGESRYQVTGKYNFRKSLREIVKTIFYDLQNKAFLDKKSFQVMVFNCWYVIAANFEWYKYSSSKKPLESEMKE